MILWHLHALNKCCIATFLWFRIDGVVWSAYVALEIRFLLLIFSYSHIASARFAEGEIDALSTQKRMHVLFERQYTVIAMDGLRHPIPPHRHVSGESALLCRCAHGRRTGTRPARRETRKRWER